MSDEIDALEEVLELCDPRPNQPARRSPHYRRPHLVRSLSKRAKIKRAQSASLSMKLKREGK